MKTSPRVQVRVIWQVTSGRSLSHPSPKPHPNLAIFHWVVVPPGHHPKLFSLSSLLLIFIVFIHSHPHTYITFSLNVAFLQWNLKRLKRKWLNIVSELWYHWSARITKSVLLKQYLVDTILTVIRDVILKFKTAPKIVFLTVLTIIISLFSSIFLSAMI